MHGRIIDCMKLTGGSYLAFLLIHLKATSDSSVPFATTTEGNLIAPCATISCPLWVSQVRCRANMEMVASVCISVAVQGTPKLRDCAARMEGEHDAITRVDVRRQPEVMDCATRMEGENEQVSRCAVQVYSKGLCRKHGAKTI